MSPGHSLNDPRNYFWVDSSATLEQLCSRLQGAEWLCLDTEFVRERTFFAIPGLLQISTDQLLACVDLVTLPNPEPLFELIYDRGVLKIFHSAIQDLEIFYQIRGAIPEPLFDTQIAATLLGFPDQVSYAGLVKSMLGGEIDKAHTRTDWTKRPLNQPQIDYALEDVIYLSRLYLEIRDRLLKTNRLDWLADDFGALLDEQRYQYEPAKAWRRIGAAKALSEKELAIAQTLAAWRETKAVKHNRPRTWILKDKALIGMAKRKPSNLAELAKIEDMPTKTLERQGQELLGLIQNATLLEPGPTQDADNPRGLTIPQQRLLEKLQKSVKQKAGEEQLDPAVLTSNRLLRRLAKGETPAHVIKGWRYHVIGKLLEQTIETFHRNEQSHAS